MLWPTLALALISTTLAQSDQSDQSDPEYRMNWGSASPLSQCRPTTIRWSGGQGPYTVRVADWDAVKTTLSPTPLRRVLAHTYAANYDWNVDYPRGSRLYIEVLDAAGAFVAPNQALTVGDGPDTCELSTPPGLNAAAASATSSAMSSGRLAATPTIVEISDDPRTRSATASARSAMASASSRVRPYDGGAFSMREPQTGDPIPGRTRTEVNSDSGPNVGLIVGTTVAGVVVLAVILGLAGWVHSLRKKNRALRARVAALEAETPMLKYTKSESVKSGKRSIDRDSEATCV